nr:MAG TPA: hypothetical protein [Herelleviridae sp.]
MFSRCFQQFYIRYFSRLVVTFSNSISYNLRLYRVQGCFFDQFYIRYFYFRACFEQFYIRFFVVMVMFFECCLGLCNYISIKCFSHAIGHPAFARVK